LITRNAGVVRRRFSTAAPRIAWGYLTTGDVMPIAIFALFLGTLSIGTTEFMISGILPQIASDLRVTIPEAGLLVTAYAISVAVGGPVMALALARLPRKVAAIVLMGLFVVGHLIVGLSADYFWAMLGRIVCAIGHGGFFGVAVVLATNIAPKERVGAALSLIFAGVTIANIVGVPIGAALGGAFGWRTPIWMVAVMASISLAAIIVIVPRTDTGSSAGGALLAQFKVLARQEVVTALSLIFLMMVAIWGFSTFFVPYMTGVAGMPAGWIPIILLLSGIFSTIGIFLGGRLADSYPTETMRFAYPTMAVSANNRSLDDDIKPGSYGGERSPRSDVDSALVGFKHGRGSRLMDRCECSHCRGCLCPIAAYLGWGRISCYRSRLSGIGYGPEPFRGEPTDPGLTIEAVHPPGEAGSDYGSFPRGDGSLSLLTLTLRRYTQTPFRS
jgi:predicted MFS family arabinose efflux permease